MSAPGPQLQPDYTASWEFLQHFHPGRLIVVTAISLDKQKIPTETFGPGDRENFLKWVAACGKSEMNIYFSVGEPMQAATKKLERTDVRAIHYLHVDLDPRAGEDLAQERARILALLRNPPGNLPPPTGIVFSGGGYQGYWKLSAPLPVDGKLEVAEDLKLYNVQIERLLGGDNCHNIDRIMRIPGTINLPDARKLKKGRTPQLAELVEWHDDRVYDVAQFTKAVERSTPRETSIAPANVPSDNIAFRKVEESDLIALGVPDRWIAIARQGVDLDDPYKHPSRSEWQWALSCEFIRNRVPDDVHFSVLMDPDWKVSASVLDKKAGADRYAIRQIREAREEVGEVLPRVFLPSGERQARECAAELGPLLRARGVYRRARTVMYPGPDGYLEPVKGDRAVTMLERVAKFMAWRPEKRNADKLVPVPAMLGKEQARVLIEADELIGELPGITVISRCPALIEEGGQLIEVTRYHEPTGIYVMPDAPSPPEVPFSEAGPALLGLLRDWNFRTDADKARAVGAIIKPALNESGMLGAGRCPMDLIEADNSQAGKGFFVEVDTAIYRDEAESVTQKERGSVGSPSETLASAMIRGHKFINFDNWRGALNIPFAESAMTQSRVDCRVPHQGNVSVDPRKTNFLMTSNGAELTEDMANRCNSVSIRKQPLGYRFHQWREGGLIEHVRANQAYYLGCVWAVLREWHRRGKPLATDEGQHDFRAWARATTYIVRDLLGLAHPLAEYRKVQMEKSTPALGWLRKVALAVKRSRRELEPLKANDLFTVIVDQEDIDIPGMTPEERHSEDEEVKRRALQSIGKRLGSAFAGASEEMLDGARVRRIVVDGTPIVRFEERSLRDASRTEKRYQFGEVPDYGTDAGAGLELAEHDPLGLREVERSQEGSPF